MLYFCTVSLANSSNKKCQLVILVWDSRTKCWELRRSAVHSSFSGKCLPIQLYCEWWKLFIHYSVVCRHNIIKITGRQTFASSKSLNIIKTMKYTLTQFLLWEFIPSGSKMQTAFPYDAAIWGKKRKKSWRLKM